MEHVIFDIDELIGFGTVKMSTATFTALKESLDEQETGHHVGQISLIHSMRAATNERLQREEAEKRYIAEFGRSNPNALEYYRSRPPVAAEPAPTVIEYPGGDGHWEEDGGVMPAHPAIETLPPVAEESTL